MTGENVHISKHVMLFCKENGCYCALNATHVVLPVAANFSEISIHQPLAICKLEVKSLDYTSHVGSLYNMS